MERQRLFAKFVVPVASRSWQLNPFPTAAQLACRFNLVHQENAEPIFAGLRRSQSMTKPIAQRHHGHA